jgi:lysozyme family protein
MADAKLAIDFVLKLEDSTLSGKVTTDAGGRTRFGIAEKFHPKLTGTGFYDEMENEEALPVAESIYEEEYWSAISGDDIKSQDIANRVLSFAVNMGPKQALTLLQKAANTLGANVSEDGVIGPSTLAAINKLNPQSLLSNFRDILTAFYHRIVAVNPSQSANLNGWLNRVKA